MDEIWTAFSLPIRHSSPDLDSKGTLDSNGNLAPPQALGGFLRAARLRLSQAAATGDRGAAAALSLVAQDPGVAAAELDDVWESRQTRLGAGAEVMSASEDFLVRLIREFAADDFAAGRTQRAAILLSSVLFEDQLGPDPALGLAVCAVRLGRLDEALALATESLRRGSRHPRAFCIAGLCELDRGERSAAQNHLAIATRVARSQPEFRNDMRMAQRLLLILNFGWKRPTQSARRKMEED